MIDLFLAKLSFWSLLTIFVFSVLAILCLSEWFNGNTDNVYEEMIEGVIEHNTGLEIDLSPDSF